jgi:hypothetical protein
MHTSALELRKGKLVKINSSRRDKLVELFSPYIHAVRKEADKVGLTLKM